MIKNLLIKNCVLDLDIALAAQSFSSLTPGSEFRPVELLAPSYHCTHSGPSSRRASPPGRNFRSAKSAQGHEAKLIDMLKEEVERGWQLPLPKSAALMIKGCEVAPLGMVTQTTINEKGNAKPKVRLTQALEFGPSNSFSLSP